MRERMAVILYKYQGLNVAQGAVLGVSESAARKLLYQALGRVRSELVAFGAINQ